MLGAGGVVGQAAVQLAAARAAPAGWSPRPGRQPHGPGPRELGADAVVAARPDDDVAALAARLRDAADGPVDLVLDPVFGVPAAARAARAAARRPAGQPGQRGRRDRADRLGRRCAAARCGVLGYTNNELTVDSARTRSGWSPSTPGPAG